METIPANINYEDVPEETKPNQALQKQLNHPFYKKVDAFRENIKNETLVKAAKKYDEPFNPSSWTIEELAKHAMAENYDQSNYIYGMYERMQKQEREIELLNIAKLEAIRLLESALTVKSQNKDTFIGYALEILRKSNIHAKNVLIDVYSCEECGQAFYVENDVVPKATPCCESWLFEYSHSGKVVNDE